MPRRTLAAGFLVFSSLVAGSALAGDNPEDRAAADALFREGRALVKQSKFADACPKLAASQKLDPAMGTLLALGDCYEHNGQTASAWATFNDAGAFARKAGDAPRATEAARRAALVEPKLSRMTVALSPQARVDGLEVRRNGKLLDPMMLGSAVPVDPGEHTLEATAPGKQPWRSTVRVEPRPGTTDVVVPALAAAAVKPGAPVAEPLKDKAPPPPPPPAAGWSTQRTVGLVVGGVGLVGVVIGTVFGVQTLSKVGEVKDNKYCDGGSPPKCTQQGVDLHKSANGTANIANVALAVGGAAVVAGVVVFATAPRSGPEKSGGLSVQVGPEVAIGTGRLSIKGAW